MKRKIKVRHFVQSHSLCGPASLKILLSHFGKNYSEKELKEMASATVESGTEHSGLVKTIKKLGGYVFEKENGDLKDLEYFINEENLPVIIGWFDKDGDHYSVVVALNEKHVITVDPAKTYPRRFLNRKLFPNIWFDFVGKENKIVSWGWYMVATFDKKKFKVKGGVYN